MTEYVKDRPEEDWLDVTLASDFASLRETGLGLGYSPTQLNGLIGDLIGRAQGQPVTTSPTTLALYRRILREVGPPPSKTPVRSGASRTPNGAAARRGSRTPRKLAAVVVSLGLGAGLVAVSSQETPRNGAVAASSGRAPIIPEREPDEPENELQAAA